MRRKSTLQYVKNSIRNMSDGVIMLPVHTSSALICRHSKAPTTMHIGMATVRML